MLINQHVLHTLNRQLVNHDVHKKLLDKIFIINACHNQWGDSFSINHIDTIDAENFKYLVSYVFNEYMHLSQLNTCVFYENINEFKNMTLTMFYKAFTDALIKSINNSIHISCNQLIAEIINLIPNAKMKYQIIEGKNIVTDDLVITVIKNSEVFDINYSENLSQGYNYLLLNEYKNNFPMQKEVKNENNNPIKLDGDFNYLTPYYKSSTFYILKDFIVIASGKTLKELCLNLSHFFLNQCGKTAINIYDTNQESIDFHLKLTVFLKQLSKIFVNMHIKTEEKIENLIKQNNGPIDFYQLYHDCYEQYWFNKQYNFNELSKKRLDDFEALKTHGYDKCLIYFHQSNINYDAI